MAVTYECISTTTVSGSAASQVNFNSIPGTYTDLILTAYLNGTRTTYGCDMNFTFNNDTGSNYMLEIFRGNASGVVATSYSAEPAVNLGVGGGNGTNYFSPVIIYFKSYADTNIFKNMYSQFGDGNLSGNNITAYTGGQWRSQSAITSMQITGNGYNFNIGSMFSLYGIKKA